MPPANAWLSITLQLPWWGAILVGIGLTFGLILGVALYRRGSQRRNLQLTELQELQRRLAVAGESGSELIGGAEYNAYLQFIYNISHEVSNPLQSIQTNLDNMARTAPEDIARWQQYHAIISAEIQRLSALAENLRLLSRLETPDIPIKREPVNIKGVIEGVMMAMAETAEARDVRLIYNGPGRPARVLGDRDHLYRLMVNLVDNSIKYSGEGSGEVVIAVQEGDQRLLVRVIDDGIGISPEDLPLVFDTAYQAPRTGSLRRAGSGLGLAIAKRIVEQHEGQINIQSVSGAGTTVSFDLPLYIPS